MGKVDTTRTGTGRGETEPGLVSRLRGPLLALVAVLALGIAAAGYAAGDDEPDAGGSGDGAPAVVERPEAAGPSTGALDHLAHRVPGDPMALGDAEAPVVLIMWSDFQCPFCGRFARETEPELVERYVENGTLRMEWRDFPYLGEQSQLAAQAGRAAAAQDRFWEFQSAVYGLELPPHSGELTAERLTQIAGDLGLDTDAFARDLASAATVEAVARDFAEGQGLGISGTPAFLVNGVPIMGAQPTEVFEETIEAALDAAGAGQGG